MSRRIGWLALIGVAVFGFGAVISGPNTVDPLLRNVLGLRPPEPVEPTPVPGAEVVADRVKTRNHRNRSARINGDLYPIQISRTRLSGTRCRRAIYRTTLPGTGSKKRRNGNLWRNLARR